MFLRMGGSAWELKIDGKRLRKKIKNDIDDRRTKRNEKKLQGASKRGPREFQEESGSPLWSIQRPQRAPKKPPRAPKKGPREPQDVFKTIFGSKMRIFPKSSSRRNEIKVCEGRRVCLGAQNRHQEAPTEDNIRHRRQNNENKREQAARCEQTNPK